MKPFFPLLCALAGCARGIPEFEGYQTGTEPVAWPDASGPAPIDHPDPDAGHSAPDAGRPAPSFPEAGPDAEAPAEDAGSSGDARAPCRLEPATCATARDAGFVLSDVSGAALVLEGAGPAFVRVLAKDGQASGNAVGGVRASLDSEANYDLVAFGLGDDACAATGLESAGPGGSEQLSPAWGTNGPFVTVDRVLTFEVRLSDDSCGMPWTLRIEGNPCPAFTLDVGPTCP